MIKKREQPQIDYFKLLSDLVDIKKETENTISIQANTVLVDGYWKMGKRLCEEDAFRRKISSFTGPILSKLAQALEMEYTLLTRVIKFYKLWPNRNKVESAPRMTWSHFRNLMTVNDSKIRDYYQREAQRNTWNARELRYRIKNQYYQHSRLKKATDSVVRNIKLKKKSAKLYVYEAKLLRVIDGDTIFVELNLGFQVKLDSRIRLRGINAPQLSRVALAPRKAVQARHFIQERLDKVSFLIVQTFKVDLYGRYVGDVYYLPGETSKERVLKNGYFLNQQLLDSGLAEYFD
ncbi:MAG: DUF1016 N-terminal domain-containing protein [Candidatus Omnitrophica bacterium]|nr:DUF1016 N-terminal domain-containing protein [Candidatus Omnitrophota bacterium]